MDTLAYGLGFVSGGDDQAYPGHIFPYFSLAVKPFLL
jgi:hypothetical protein